MYRANKTDETISAIATPPGEGGIAIVRLSGKAALQIASALFHKRTENLPSHTIHHGFALDSEGEIIDEILLLIMKAPRSFTGEDVIEIHCHGGHIASHQILKRTVELGARIALPGEFSFRAYINEKIDLAQAEAISALIEAKSERAFKQEKELLMGALSKKITRFQEELNDIAAIFEAWVDFPEEGLEFASKEHLQGILEGICQRMGSLIATFAHGVKLKTSPALCLIGAPNVGKSSLLNALVGFERAIVTPIAGTTRDLIEEQIKSGSYNYRLIDTAGLRESHDCIEKEGIERSKQALNQADLLLIVLDATAPLTESERQLIENHKERSIVIFNKIDRSHPPLESVNHPHKVALSAHTKQGLNELTHLIDELLWSHLEISKEEVILTHERHKAALSEALGCAEKALVGLKADLSPEWLCLELRCALAALSSLVGSDVSDDLLSSIFSKFCIGK